MSDTYKVECARCMGTGLGGSDNRNGVFQSGRCYACAGLGSVEYQVRAPSTTPAPIETESKQ